MAAVDTERSLGRIEGTQTQILDKLDKLSEALGDHKNEDQRNFSSIRALMDRKMEEQTTTREAHLGAQDVKLDALKQDADRAKGAGWVILALLGSLATFVGGAVLAVLGGWVHVKIP